MLLWCVLRGSCGSKTGFGFQGGGWGGGGVGDGSSVYEKHFGTTDIMSDVFRLCVGHFHIVLDLFFFFNNANQFKDRIVIIAKIWDIFYFQCPEVDLKFRSV